MVLRPNERGRVRNHHNHFKGGQARLGRGLLTIYNLSGRLLMTSRADGNQFVKQEL